MSGPEHPYAGTDKHIAERRHLPLYKANATAYTRILRANVTTVGGRVVPLRLGLGGICWDPIYLQPGARRYRTGAVLWTPPLWAFLIPFLPLITPYPAEN